VPTPTAFQGTNLDLHWRPKPYLDVAELTRVQLMHELGYDVPE